MSDDKNNKNEQPYQLPQSLKSQLFEHTNGGYVLFYIDANNDFQVEGDFDGAAQMIGLHSYVKKWGISVDDIDQEIIHSNFFQEPPDDSGAEDEEPTFE